MAREEDQSRSSSSFQKWMALQEQDLGELLESLTITENPDPMLVELIQKAMTHFEEYIERRAKLFRNDVSAFFAPAWNSSLENSVLWIGGCRPSSFFRLLYALCGSEVSSHLDEFLRGEVSLENIRNLSWKQLHEVDELHRRTIKEEENLGSRLASLQEDTADQPISVVFQRQRRLSEPDENVDRALDHHEEAMATLLMEADKLRLRTFKELVGIMTPVQAVDFMAAAKKLHLCIHELGKRRDCLHGRKQCGS